MPGTGTAVAAANFAATTIERQPELVALFERLFEAQDPDTYIRCCRILMQDSAAGLPARVRIPCLSISGTADHYAPPDLVTRFTGEIPNCTQEIIPDCGHFPFLEQPEAFTTRLRSFIERVC